MNRLRLVAAVIVVAVPLGAGQAAAAPVKQRTAPSHILDRVERPLIVGGLPASPGTFSMMAFVVYEDSGTGDIFVCSGTVVAPTVVLTAGHCALNDETGAADVPAGYAVVTGSLDWTSPVREVSAVTRTIINPAYDPATGDGDAALLVLASPTTAPAVPLAADPGDLGLMQAGSAVQIAGWGLTLAGTIPDQLQWGVTTVQTPSSCSVEAGAGGASFDPSAQMCTMDDPAFADATCNGDSGGPLLGRRADGTWVEIGVTNFGPTDCSLHIPDFFARADSISPWVASAIQSLSGSGAGAGSGAPSAPVGTPPPPGTPRPAPVPPTWSLKPLAGVYRGRTSQHFPLTVQVAASRTAVSSLSFGFTLSCTRHRRVSYRISPGRGHLTWPLKQQHGLGFDDRFTDSTGEHYEVKGSFDSTGSAAGFISTAWRSRRLGTCRSGLVSWSARAS
ncbi:MAG TPA: serine protease [Solirubrobacteraceae bacterium]